ncbi:MAG TPA: NUDIX domain-containing protein [Streptosporangiaceae bacterium]|nr:NUDIX domain-containing protein [Streptosporangiaceae bacterium]
MTERDGNGWVSCSLGHQHWGRYGAAGLLVSAPDRSGQIVILLQRRAGWTACGGTWGTPGGARDSHEPAAAAALREAAEECGLPPEAVRITGMRIDDHGGWSYRTLLARAEFPCPVHAASPETAEAVWIPVGDVGGLGLHPGFAGQWPVIREALAPISVIVDGANVMGARADGWWRDRAAAAARLHSEISALSARGVGALPEGAALAGLDWWFPEFTLVIEGAARAAAGRLAASGADVRVVAAGGSGDDSIAALAGQLPGRRLVVTADRELRRRCTAQGASVTGPRWLLGLLRRPVPDASADQATA